MQILIQFEFKVENWIKKGIRLKHKSNYQMDPNLSYKRFR